MTVHPLLPVLLAAASGEFPPADGAVVALPPLPGGLAAVVSLTGRAYVAADEPPDGLDAFGGTFRPEVLLRLAGPGGEVGTLDVTLVAHGLGGGVGGGGLPARTDLDGHPRVRHARAIRRDVRVYGDERGLVTLAAGLAGRRELSLELSGQGERGVGRGLITDALGLVPAGEPVFAAVAPGNARSLRAFLAVGFQPVGAEVILRTAAGSAR
ncbi:N-acetyltransferase [Actinophytocola gossypii]|uniref:N-acetyltransferase n=1 Tax=Actinophytocola gossypii TaxID=2812003 RepID=A0ABT2J1G9_9PSEU|nr:N-acetyltransferase [Actinophytocola gossypii]MCT2581707.1 N-acetyltransferase [Actinophytocola gossypii]